MASGRLIKLYKGVFLVHIHDKLIHDGVYTPMEELDAILKENSGINKSCSSMTNLELQEHIEMCFEFAGRIGLKLDYKDCEQDKLIRLKFNRTEDE